MGGSSPFVPDCEPFSKLLLDFIWFNIANCFIIKVKGCPKRISGCMIMFFLRVCHTENIGFKNVQNIEKTSFFPGFRLANPFRI